MKQPYILIYEDLEPKQLIDMYIFYVDKILETNNIRHKLAFENELKLVKKCMNSDNFMNYVNEVVYNNIPPIWWKDFRFKKYIITPNIM